MNGQATPRQLAHINRLLASHLLHAEEVAGVRDYLKSRKNDKRIAMAIIDELHRDLAERRVLEKQLEREQLQFSLRGQS